MLIEEEEEEKDVCPICQEVSPPSMTIDPQLDDWICTTCYHKRGKKTKEAPKETLDEQCMRLFKRKRKIGECVACGTDKVRTKDFTDELSRTEYQLIYCCQKCQDKAFGPLVANV